MSILNKDFGDLTFTQVLDPATVTTDATSSSVDCKEHDAVAFVVPVGESGDTLSGSVKIELELEESDDDSTFTDVADSDVEDFVAGTNDGTFALIDAPAEDDAVYVGIYRGNARYVRCIANLTGTHTSGTPLGIVAVRGRAKYRT